MNEERLQQLLSAAADGDLSVAEQAELESMLREFPEAGRLQQELLQVEKILGDLAGVEPPADLHDRIMTSVVLPERKADRSIGDWLRLIRPAPVLRHAFSMAVGVMLAVSLYESQPKFSQSEDISELVGTMAPDSGKAGRKILDSFTVSALGVSSIARLEQRDDTLVLDVRIDTRKAVEIAIDFGSGLEFTALAQTLSSLDSIEYTKKILKVSGHGQRRFAVMMRAGADAAAVRENTIRLEYSSEGAILQQGVLSSAR